MLPLLRLFLVSLAIVAAAPTARADDLLQAVLDKHIDTEDLPGGLLLLSEPGQRRLVVSGVANRRGALPVSPQTRFYVASVGKMTVAAAILQLVDEGRLTLDSPVAPLVGHVPGIAKMANLKKVTVGQLLDHSSGLPEYLTDSFTEDSHKDFKRRWTAAEALAYAVGEAATGKPGEAHEYCNTNYALLGEILVGMDGAPLAEVLRRRIFEPAGMNDSMVGVADPDDPRLAHGYADLDDTGKKKDVSRLSWNFPFGDGPMVTTAADLERFLFALFRDNRLLKPGTVARMTRPSEAERDYGLGVERGKDKLGRWVGHTGSFDGFEAEARYYPERKTVTLFMTNGDSSTDANILDRLAKRLAKAEE